MRYDQEVKIKQAAEETRRRRRCVAHVLRCVHVLAGPLCVLDVVAAGRTSTASVQLTCDCCPGAKRRLRARKRKRRSARCVVRRAAHWLGRACSCARLH